MTLMHHITDNVKTSCLFLPGCMAFSHTNGIACDATLPYPERFEEALYTLEFPVDMSAINIDIHSIRAA